MKKIILIILALLLMVGMVGSVSAIRFKNAILLNESGFTPFGMRLNDSFEVTGDINVSLEIGGFLNFIGYSSKNSINVNDVIVYNSTGNTKLYQDAKTAGWINSINKSVGSGIGDEAITLNEYGSYWVTSFTGVNLSFIGVGGSNTSVVFPYIDLLLYNGSTYLNMTEASDSGWVSQNLRYWDANQFKNINKFGIGGKTFLNSWEGTLIESLKPNIYLLFENKTLNVEIHRELYMGLKENGVEVLSITTQAPTKLTLGFFIEVARVFWKSWIG